MSARRALPGWQLVAALAVVALVANTITFFAFTRPREERSRRAKELAQELSATLAAERAGVERLRLRAKTIEDNGRDVRLFLTQTLTTQREGLAADLDALESAFRASGVHVSRRTYRRQPLHGIAAVQIDHALALTGGAAQVASFLKQLETGPRFLVINQVRLNQQTEGRSTVEATVASFYRLEGSDQETPPARGTTTGRTPSARPGA